MDQNQEISKNNTVIRMLSDIKELIEIEKENDEGNSIKVLEDRIDKALRYGYQINYALL